MLVGEVRWASTGSGSSWKLSGGRWWLRSSTNVSKKRQVRRPSRREERLWLAESTRDCRGFEGTLTSHATTGDSIQSRANGAATGQAAGLKTANSAPAAAPSS